MKEEISGGSTIDPASGNIDIPAGGNCNGTSYPNGAIVKPDGSVLKRTVLTLASNSSTVKENIGSFTFAYTYDGNGAVNAISSNPEAAEATVDPDEGYRLDELNVTDLHGKTVKLKDEGNGKFTFTMPASRVVVEAVFGETDANQDELFFTDVPSDAYYADAVKWAVAEGITTGTSDTTFSPEDSCTRGQIVTFMHRNAK